MKSLVTIFGTQTFRVTRGTFTIPVPRILFQHISRLTFETAEQSVVQIPIVFGLYMC